MSYEAHKPLLGPGDPHPYQVVGEHARSEALIVSDHAGRAIPAALEQLGLEPWALDRHIAWDIGADALTLHLARSLDATAVLANYSRLVVDPNRRLDAPTAFLEQSDGIRIPGNLALTEEQKLQRARCCYWPYHRRIAGELRTARARGLTPAVISLHSFVPSFHGVRRPWHIGVLWNRDGRIAEPLTWRLAQMRGVVIGANEPYSGRHSQSFTLNHHAEPTGLPHVGIELRHDLIADDAGARHWAEVLAWALRPVLEQLGLIMGLRDTG